nr:hypothetical transcript [Hymenolepis microstoma]
MIFLLLVSALLLINGSFEAENPKLPYSICSRIVAKPSGKTEPMIIIKEGKSPIEVRDDSGTDEMLIENGVCKKDGSEIGKPCDSQPSNNFLSALE